VFSALEVFYENALYKFTFDIDIDIDIDIVGSNPARGYCVLTPTQRVIPLGSVNE